jgi:hypothetical protein
MPRGRTSCRGHGSSCRLESLAIEDLRVGTSVRLTRAGSAVDIEVTRRRGRVEIETIR